jgi:hypothetical protein
VGPRDPATAPVVAIDRFSDAAAMLFRRSANTSLPGPNAPVDFDAPGPLITHGLGPGGEHVTYYNFDIQPTSPAPIYVFFAEGAASEVAGQLHVIDVLPGDKGYNDFWQVIKVTVPTTYVANTLTSAAEIVASGFALTPTTMLVNCPVVPDRSTAQLRYKPSESTGLVSGWYRDQLVKYFTFGEASAPLATTSAGAVPTAPIFVTFNKNPNSQDPTSGPPSGFVTEPGTVQTHNVITVLPVDPAYSPLWSVAAYDNASFAVVHDLASAMAAPLLVPDAGAVNCPVVAVSVNDAGALPEAGAIADAAAD